MEECAVGSYGNQGVVSLVGRLQHPISCTSLPCESGESAKEVRLVCSLGPVEGRSSPRENRSTAVTPTRLLSFVKMILSPISLATP
jgi:hypothetical protein